MKSPRSILSGRSIVSGRSRRSVKRTETHESGAAAIAVALSMGLFFATLALVMDLGYARQVARFSQGAVDAAALAGAQDLPFDDEMSESPAHANAARQTAMEYVLENTFPSAEPTSCSADSTVCATSVAGATVEITTPYSMPESGLQPYQLIKVRLCREGKTLAAQAIQDEAPDVCREAVARRRKVEGDYRVALLSLHPTQCAALQFRGNADTNVTLGGAVIVNSNCVSDNNNGALDAAGSNWKLVAGFIGSVGSATLDPCEPPNTTNCTTTLPTEGIQPVPDPFGLQPPSPLPALSPTQCWNFNSGGPYIMEPGRYTERCNFAGNGNNNPNYIFRPGVYYFTEGFRSGGGAMVCSDSATTFPLPVGSTCSGVTFIAAKDFRLNGNGKVFLPPPATGTYAGVTIFQTTADTSVINGTNDFSMGTIYAPSALLKFEGTGGGTEVNIAGQVIGRMVDIGGTFDLNIEPPDDVEKLALPDDIGLED